MLGPCVAANSEISQIPLVWPASMLAKHDADGYARPASAGDREISRCPHLVVLYSEFSNGGFAMNVRGIRALCLSAAGVALTSLALAGTASASEAHRDVSTGRPHLAAYAVRASSAGTIWAYVVNAKFGTVTPINTATNKAAKTIKVGSDPVAIAITPNGKTAMVVNYGSGTVTPIPISGGRNGPAIAVGSDPTQMAITPSGVTGYVVSRGSNTVTPIHLASDTPLSPISFAYSSVTAVAIAPSQKIVYAIIPAKGVIAEIQAATDTVSGYVGSGPRPVNMAIAQGE